MYVQLCTEEGVQLPQLVLSHLLEQWVGIELIRKARLMPEPAKILYWRDHSGPEIDYVIEHHQRYIPKISQRAFLAVD